MLQKEDSFHYGKTYFEWNKYFNSYSTECYIFNKRCILNLLQEMSNFKGTCVLLINFEEWHIKNGHTTHAALQFV